MNNQLILTAKEAKLVQKLFKDYESNELWNFSLEFARASSPVNVYIGQEKSLVIERADYGGVFASENYASLKCFNQAYE